MGSPHRWRIAGLLACAGALNYADRAAISSVFPLLRAEFQLTDVQLGAIGTFFLWSYAACSPWAGLLADRISRKRMVVASLAAWSAVTILTGLAQSTTQLMVTRVLLGLAECAYLPAAVGLVADHHESGSRGRALALHMCGLNAGLIAGGALAGYLGDAFGWRVSFWWLGGVGLLLALVCWRWLEDGPLAANRSLETTTRRRPITAQLSTLLRQPAFVLLATEAMLMAVGTWMFFNWMPLYFRETFGLSLAVAGFSGTATLQVSAVTGIALGGMLSDRIVKRSGRRQRLVLMMACYLVAAPMLIIFTVPASMAVVSSVIVVFSLVRGIGMACETPALCDMLPSDERSTGQGLLNMLNTFAGGVGVLAAGALKQDFGLGGVFAGVAGLIVIAAGFAWAASRKMPPAVATAVTA